MYINGPINSGCKRRHLLLFGPLLLTAGPLWVASSWRGNALGKGEWEVVDRFIYSEVDSEISRPVVVLELPSWGDELIGLHLARP